MKDIKELIGILHRGNHTLVIENEKIVTFNNRGIVDLFNILNRNDTFLKGAIVADKVVGKGAAALMILGMINEVHADVISESALDLFNSTPVKVSYQKVVKNIINRKGDGICPIEALCSSCTTAQECLPLITKFLISNQLITNN